MAERLGAERWIHYLSFPFFCPSSVCQNWSSAFSFRWPRILTNSATVRGHRVRFRRSVRVIWWSFFMNPALDTRYSLLLRVCDPADGKAWGEFWRLYEPVVYRMARRFGMQD